MSDWERFRHDLRGGITSLGARLVHVAHRTGRELSVVEHRRELARLERELARRYQEIGEVAYEGWRHAGVISLRAAEMQVRLEAIAALTIQRDAVRRELAHEEGADVPPAKQGGV
jgi:hypothetical protein